MTNFELFDYATGETLDPDHGRDGGGPSDFAIWHQTLGYYQSKPSPDDTVHWLVRPARVAELRAMPYTEYLSAPEWKYKRRQMVKSREQRCERCCGRGQLQVHHRNYERIGCEEVEDLEVLCARCHRREHGIAA